MPFFMENDEWYTISYDEYGNAIYLPTKKAPKKAIQSIKDYEREYKEEKEWWEKRCMGPTEQQDEEK